MRVALRATIRGVVLSFKHRGLHRFFETKSAAGIPAAQSKRIAAMLAQLQEAEQPSDMNFPGWKLHPLKGFKPVRWSVWVSGNVRLTFAFDGRHVVDVDLEDYH